MNDKSFNKKPEIHFFGDSNNKAQKCVSLKDYNALLKEYKKLRESVWHKVGCEACAHDEYPEHICQMRQYVRNGKCCKFLEPKQ